MGRLNLPPTHGGARDAALLTRIVQGQYDPIQWGQVTSTIDGHTATFLVFADALSMDSVRINVGGVNIQQIADLTNCMLCTPKIADMIYLQRALLAGTSQPLTLMPSPQPESMDTAGWERQSATIDSLLAAAGAASGPAIAGTLPPGGILNTIGKYWVLDNDSLNHPGRACNYGWHFPGTTFGGSAWESSVTPPLRCIQGRGWAHTIQENLDDYSQKCVLVSRECIVDGVQRDLADVLSTATLASLASHQGVLRVLRQPGVPPYAAGAIPSASA